MKNKRHSKKKRGLGAAIDHVDNVVSDLNRQILEEPFQTVAYLAMRNGKPVYVALDHGDDEGASEVRTFILDCERQGLVAPGELVLHVAPLMIVTTGNGVNVSNGSSSN